MQQIKSIPRNHATATSSVFRSVHQATYTLTHSNF